MHGGTAGEQVLHQSAQRLGALIVEATYRQCTGFFGIGAGWNVDTQCDQSLTKLGLAYLFVTEHGLSPVQDSNAAWMGYPYQKIVPLRETGLQGEIDQDRRSRSLELSRLLRSLR